MEDKKVVVTKNPKQKELLDNLKNEIRSIALSQEKRDKISSIVNELLPQEHIEETPLAEDNVMCKLMTKGHPKALYTVADAILSSLIVKNTNGTIDLNKTGEYVMTLLIEKIPKKSENP